MKTFSTEAHCKTVLVKLSRIIGLRPKDALECVSEAAALTNNINHNLHCKAAASRPHSKGFTAEILSFCNRHIIFSIFLMSFLIPPMLAGVEDPAGFEKQLQTNPNDTDILLKLGRIYHDMGAKGDKDAVNKAADYLEKLIALNPNHAEAHCWYGSVLTLKGRDAWFPLSKANYVNKGMAEMDKAVSLAQDNILIRMIRAANGIALPEMFNRLQTAVSDYEYLKNRGKEKPGSIDGKTYLSVLFNLGCAYTQKGDFAKSKENFNLILEMDPNTELAKTARAKLAQLDAKEKR
jgi:tetratricopeptide (TPR) repeat protein